MSSSLSIPSPAMIIDVVDDRDRKSGEVRRADVLALGRNFHTAHLFLIDEENRLLLQQLAATRERHALRWGASVAGYLFADESYEAAIQRRAHQELGVTVHPSPVGILAVSEDSATKFVALFEASVTGTLTPDPEHIAAIRFASLDEVAAELHRDRETFTPTFQRLFPFYREHRLGA
jgi:isopentenyl-diphosphate Delta-isomerase